MAVKATEKSSSAPSGGTGTYSQIVGAVTARSELKAIQFAQSVNRRRAIDIFGSNARSATVFARPHRKLS
jgi:hypothetical protein